MQVEHLKRWLESYQERQQDLDSNYERLERLEARLTSTRSAALSGLSGAAASDPERLTFPVAELQELQAETKKQAALRKLAARRKIKEMRDGVFGNTPGSMDLVHTKQVLHDRLRAVQEAAK